MTISLEMVIAGAGAALGFIISLVVAVWKITDTSNKNKNEVITAIHEVDKRLVAIEVITEDTKGDHDKVVELNKVVEGLDEDVARQWGRIRHAENREQG